MSAVISHASQVQMPTNITQLIWSTYDNESTNDKSDMKVEIHYNNKATISIVRLDLDPVEGPGADLAAFVVWVQAGPEVSSIPFERVDISYTHLTLYR